MISTEAGRLTAVHAGRPTWRVTPEGKRWRSSFVKQSVEGPVRLDWGNLDGDQQADLRVHGGPDMAVLCYAAEHYPLWLEELDLAGLGSGGFGENFTIAGQEERTVCLGDAYEVGEAIVQVSQPRGPCFKISRRWNRPELLGRVVETGRHGWYLRVLQPGLVEAGQGLKLVDRPYPEWTVRRAADTLLRRKSEPAAASALLECEALGASARRDLAKAV